MKYCFKFIVMKAFLNMLNILNIFFYPIDANLTVRNAAVQTLFTRFSLSETCTGVFVGLWIYFISMCACVCLFCIFVCVRVCVWVCV